MEFARRCFAGISGKGGFTLSLALLATLAALALVAQAAHPARSAAFISNGCDEDGCEEPEGPAAGGDSLPGDSGGWAFEDSSSDGQGAGTPDNYQGDDLIQDEHGSGDEGSTDEGDYQGYEDTDERLDLNRDPQPLPEPEDPWHVKRNDPFSAPHPTREQQEMQWKQENCIRIRTSLIRVRREGPDLADRALYPLQSKKRVKEILLDNLTDAYDDGNCFSAMQGVRQDRRSHRHR